ncbi:hypothetical protein [Streptomyces sp. NPDC048637]|uniref:hypothetical protein n=1 Tax=Streptomyces sp. NPDC048637 TaxID=3155636 RepID=UPI003414E5FA
MTGILPRTSEVGHWLWVLVEAGLSLWWIALAAAVAWITAAVWWRRRAVRELADRTRVEVVPAATFAPELLVI